MTNLKSMLGIGAAALLVAACDPYNKTTGADPAIVGVTATNASESTSGVQAGTAWTVDGLTSTCNPVAGTITADQPILFVTFNKQMDPTSIQKSVSDCTPAGATPWLTVTPPAPAGLEWFSCYSPSSPSAAEGGSTILFLGPNTPADVAACKPASTPASGWSAPEAVDAQAVKITTYHFTGSVRDLDGRALPIDITANVDPDPGTVRNFTVSGDDGVSSVTLAWRNRPCASTTDQAAVAYEIHQLNPDTVVATVAYNASPPSPTVTKLAADVPVTFEIFTVTTPPGTTTSVKTLKATLANVIPNLLPPGQPTASFNTPNATDLAAGKTGTITVTIPAAVAGATDHDVYRATSATGAMTRLGAMGTDATTGTLKLSFEDKTAAANTNYVYKVVATKKVGTVTARGADSLLTTPALLTLPGKPPAGTAVAATDTSITLEWPLPGGIGATGVGNTYTLERAPDASGAPGAWATAGGTAVPDANAGTVTIVDSTGLTAGTTYWYRLTVGNATGSSIPSDPFSAKTAALPAPTGVTVAHTGTTATVTWTAVPGAAAYIVERSLSNACGFAPVGSTTAATTFTDSAAPAGTVSYYEVIARDAAGGESAPSAPAP